jgi:phenylacetate-CoA ligase
VSPANRFEAFLERRGYPFRQAAADLSRLSGTRGPAIAEWQRGRLDEIVRFHAERNPLYRSLLGGPPPRDWRDLPIVDKSAFQRPVAECLSEGVPKADLHVSSTSGSSGTPFFFARDKYTHARTWALIAEAYAWHGIGLGSRQARFYGIPREPIPRMKEMAKDRLMNRARFPVFDLSDPVLERFRRRLAKDRFDYAYGYTNSLAAFADYLHRAGVRLKAECPTLRVCIVTSEMCTPEDRERLERALGVPVVNEYGASETGVIALEDVRRAWRTSWKTLFLEVVDDDGRPVPDGSTGQIVITDLYNRAMPFIRYRIGDLGSLRSAAETASGEPEIAQLEGRINDTILLPSGRRAAGLTFYYVSRGLLEKSGVMKEFIIRQTALDEFVFDVVSDAPLSSGDVRTIEAKMSQYLEPGLRLRVRRVDAIERPASGKRKHFFSELPADGAA